jgi:DNA-binding NtrC family response regulator
VATILILDEETDSCMLLKRLLERNAHNVWAARTPADALECAATRNLDMVLVSVTSRRGLDAGVLEELKSIHPALRVMVIGDHLPKDALEGMSVDDYLVKPVDIDAVERKVRELLQRRPQDLRKSG